MKRYSSPFLLPLIVLSLAACSKFEDRLYILKLPELPTVSTYAPENITRIQPVWAAAWKYRWQYNHGKRSLYLYIRLCRHTRTMQVPGFNEWRYSDNNSVGHFSVFLRDLKPNTTYNYRLLPKMNSYFLRGYADTCYAWGKWSLRSTGRKSQGQHQKGSKKESCKALIYHIQSCNKMILSHLSGAGGSNFVDPCASVLQISAAI